MKSGFLPPRSTSSSPPRNFTTSCENTFDCINHIFGQFDLHWCLQCDQNTYMEVLHIFAVRTQYCRKRQCQSEKCPPSPLPRLCYTILFQFFMIVGIWSFLARFAKSAGKLSENEKLSISTETLIHGHSLHLKKKMVLK